MALSLVLYLSHGPRTNRSYGPWAYSPDAGPDRDRRLVDFLASRSGLQGGLMLVGKILGLLRGVLALLFVWSVITFRSA